MKFDSLFGWLGIKGTTKLFQINYGLHLSKSFIKCADSQLSTLFRQITNLKIGNRIRFVTISKEEGFIYSKGKISKLSFQLQLPFLAIPVIVCWKSLSIRTYDIGEEVIDCNDIEFWFENLDLELCHKANKPTWSLIPEIYQPLFINSLKQFGINFSASFIFCMDKQLSEQFQKRTGIKISKRIRLSLTHFSVAESQLTYGEVSKIKGRITIIEEEPINVKVCWRSKSDRIFKIEDEVVDCNDIEFWFEDFKPEVYIQQYYPNQQLPFKIKDITYELVVNRIYLDCTIVMTLKLEARLNAERFVEEIDNFIAAFNDKSEKKDRKEGVIHNWNTDIQKDKIIYNLDLGSTGISFFKKLLTFLSKLNVFLKVEIE